MISALHTMIGGIPNTCTPASIHTVGRLRAAHDDMYCHLYEFMALMRVLYIGKLGMIEL